MLSFVAPTRARVAQWIRAFASGAKGRRFDPCRGYQSSPTLTNVMETLPTGQPVKHTILVVDDFDDTRLLLKTWLEKKGFNVVEAENGNQAVVAAHEMRPDLIIMDIEMPELDGLAATRKIRTLKELDSVPVFAVSAYGAQQFRAEALAAGCSEYVSTPFEPDDLEKLIRSFLP